MDVTGGSLNLLGGLEILGKLVFPDGYKLNLSANIVIVQGELEMTATKAVDGIPNIKLTMVGSNDFAFTPIDANARACGGNNTCPVGKKGIIVAGGTVNIHGLPSNTLAWTRLYGVVGTSNNPDTILVPSSVIEKWGVGSEIAITSHTRVWNETQVRTITDVAPSNGMAALTLNSPILRPTTMSESPDFAVEVALLSRNIRFEGGPDSNSRHGGHFLVYHTPTLVQTIEGVDFYNFGQQGNLGKYPIHFHYCTDVAGSIVLKNTIRQSNQRCVVVHGTNKLRIQENVAFDTKGHCYMTEDGIENNNEFIRNLGAQTGIPATIIPNSGPNGDETDGEPATFWITNPTNSWIGNVAAGSEHSGYWFEPKLRGTRASAFPGLDPQTAPLIAFQDNVAHSNMAGRLVSFIEGLSQSKRVCIAESESKLIFRILLNGQGAIRMYVPGYFPTSLTSFSGLKIYRNDAVGMFIHRCENILLENSLFADNNIGVDHDRSEGIVMRNLKVIGQSPLYEALMARQPGVKPVCFRGERVGIDLHTWQKEIEVYAGAKISNVDISGFSPSDPNCATPSSVRFDILVS
jgi:G8 domain